MSKKGCISGSYREYNQKYSRVTAARRVMHCPRGHRSQVRREERKMNITDAILLITASAITLAAWIIGKIYDIKKGGKKDGKQ